MPTQSPPWVFSVSWVCILLGHTVSAALWSPSPSASKQQVPASACRDHVELLAWAVQVGYDPRRDSPRHIDQIADRVAEEVGLVNRGQIGSLRGHYQLEHKLHNDHFYDNVLVMRDSTQEQGKDKSRLALPEHWSVKEISHNDWKTHLEWVRDRLDLHPNVEWYTQLHAFRRNKRSIEFKDPAFPRQWHLKNTRHRGQDLNIMRVWERNITGKGVVAAVVDDGLEWNNPDIAPNYFPAASYDLNNYDRDPMPSFTDKKNHHGTRCAGEIAAAANSACAVGVAFEAQIAGLKVLDGPMTDSLEGVAFTKGKDLIDVYSCSWGPDDDGKTVDGPHFIALKALREAVDYGRKGYGSIFVVASGNGGTVDDNCNFDGYANSIYTVTIGAVDEMGSMPYYAEECASMLAVTYSSGSGNLRSIVTTDWQQAGGTGCTDRHTGTSAAAPLAAGMVALMLQARPCLTWRDVQHIIVMAAVKVDIDVAHWTRNKAGFHHSHKHGFGLMDAWRLVNAAKVWHPVPWMTLYSTEEMAENTPIPPRGQKLELTYTVDDDLLDGFNLYTLEYVHAIVTLEHRQRGSLEIRLRCPSRTESVLAAPRKLDKSGDGFDRWTFSTVRCWGEPPEGAWVMTVRDKGPGKTSRGVFKRWQLKLYGSAMSEEDVARRRRLVESAASGESLHDNFSLPCPPPPLRNKPVSVISQKNLKILVLASAFCLVMAVYETLEYMFCYDEEKKKHQEDMKALAEQRHTGEGQLANGEGATRRTPPPDEAGQANSDDASEATRLLSTEEIPLDNISPTENSVNNGTVVPFSPHLKEVVRHEGVADKMKYIVLRFFRGRSHRYAVLSEKALLAEEDTDDVVFDVSDHPCAAETTAEATSNHKPRHSSNSSMYTPGDTSVICHGDVGPHTVLKDDVAETRFISGSSDVTTSHSFGGSLQGGATAITENGSTKPVSAEHLVVLNPTG